MNIINAIAQLRDDLKIWVTHNLNALNNKIEEKTVTIDNILDSTSLNPVQNQAITNEINNLNNLIGDTTVSEQISQAISKQEHFSGDYNDLTNAPNIITDEENNLIIADKLGNIIFQIDEEGVKTTSIKSNGKVVATEEYVQQYTEELEATDEEVVNVLFEADLLPVLLDDEGIITEFDNTMIFV